MPEVKTRLLDKGIISGTNTYKTKVTVLKYSKTISVVQVDPNGSRALVIVPINGASAQFNFNPNASDSRSSVANDVSTRTASKKASEIPAGTLAIPSDGQLLANATYVINSGETKSVKLADGVQLYVAGTCTMSGPEATWNSKGDDVHYLRKSGCMY